MSKSLAIFGAGVSGQAARRLAQAKGFSVVLFDESGRGDRASFEADEMGDYEAFVFSPGFAADHPWRQLVEASGKACLSELSFAAQFWTGRMIGVTGTNGKTTTTELLRAALCCAGETSVAAGNIGDAFSEVVLSESNRSDATAVLEISSFQAELAEGLSLDALIWTNFAEDHLDRYPTMQAYFAAKARLLDCVGRDGVCVVGPQAAEWIARERGGLGGCHVVNEKPDLLSALAEDSVFKRPPFSENFALAASLWALLKRPADGLLRAADAFELSAHRLSLVADIRNVRFWNDSKATNFHAALAALDAVEGPIVWIGGGQSKGGQLDAFARQVAPRVDAVILYGQVAEPLKEAFAASVDSIQVHHVFADAVNAAADLAFSMPGANVLLSPGFASFDQFASYDARGKTFIDMVLGLKRRDELH